jgi:hypothetical protein
MRARAAVVVAIGAMDGRIIDAAWGAGLVEVEMAIERSDPPYAS